MIKLLSFKWWESYFNLRKVVFDYMKHIVHAWSEITSLLIILMLHSLLFLPKNNIERIKQVVQRKPWERLFEKIVNGQMSQTNFAKNL